MNPPDLNCTTKDSDTTKNISLKLKLEDALFKDDITTNDTSEVNNKVLHRNDDRCGSEFLLSNGLPAQCNPDGQLFCCSEYGYCGGTSEHCECEKCINYQTG